MNITTSPRGAEVLTGKALVEGGAPTYVKAFWNGSKLQSVELWNVEDIDYWNCSLVEQIDAMAWVLAATTKNVLIWKFSLTGSYPGVAFHRGWAIGNYAPGTFAYGTYYLRVWAMQAPVINGPGFPETTAALSSSGFNTVV